MATGSEGVMTDHHLLDQGKVRADGLKVEIKACRIFVL